MQDFQDPLIYFDIKFFIYTSMYISTDTNILIQIGVHMYTSKYTYTYIYCNERHKHTGCEIDSENKDINENVHK